MSRLAVLFPGIGYTADKPLLYYSRKLAERAGYEVKVIRFSDLPGKVKGDRDRLRLCCRLALQQAKECLSGVDLSGYDDVLLIGKSIGTITAAETAADCAPGVPVRFILFTPLEETFSYPIGDAIVFTGSADQWTGAGKNTIEQLCRQHDIPCRVIDGANHSLETADPLSDIKNLQEIMTETAGFIRKEQFQRIAYHETLLNELTGALSTYDPASYDLSCLSGIADELERYYMSNDWRQDYEDDESGLLPEWLKRGVLSEDGIYDALEAYGELTGRLPDTDI